MRRAELRALRGKYERILTLRLLHARAREEPDFDEPDPRRELASLAAEFPGALREIDELPLATIRDRIDALLAAERAGQPEPWMEASHLVHAFARGALATKRWLGKRRGITRAHREAFQEAIDARDLPREALAWETELDAIARPPRGRLMDLVYARAAAELGIDVARVRALTCPSRKKKKE